MIQTGITALQLGDGAGGKAALSINERVLRILYNTELNYILATAMNPQQIQHGGTIIYNVPELIQTKAYDPSIRAFDVPQNGIKSININQSFMSDYETEAFDMTRMEEWGGIMGQIATGLAMAAQATLNAIFLKYVTDLFLPGAELASQVLILPDLGIETSFNVDKSRQAYNQLQIIIVKLSQIYDKTMIGVSKAELHTILSPIADVNLRNAFWNQPNATGEFVISDTLKGKKLGNIKYTLDNMLGMNIPAGSSFSADQSFDFANILGLIFHNEAIAMPIKINAVMSLIDNYNGNPKFLMKVQYGIGHLRPKLIYAILKETATPASLVLEEPKTSWQIEKEKKLEK